MFFKLSKPKNITLCNALYVPKLACNLFSVGGAATRGDPVRFVTKVDKLYYLDYKSRVRNKVDLCNQWLRHLNEQQLKEMVRHDLVKGVKIPKSAGIISVNICEKKMSRKPFKSVGEI